MLLYIELQLAGCEQYMYPIITMYFISVPSLVDVYATVHDVRLLNVCIGVDDSCHVSV